LCVSQCLCRMSWSQPRVCSGQGYGSRFEINIELSDELSNSVSTGSPCTGVPLDFVFVIDSSRSIRPLDYEKVKTFVLDLLQFLEVGPDSTRVALLQYGSVVQSEFSLDAYTTRAEVERAVRATRHMASGTMTGVRAVIWGSLYGVPPLESSPPDPEPELSPPSLSPEKDDALPRFPYALCGTTTSGDTRAKTSAPPPLNARQTRVRRPGPVSDTVKQQSPRNVFFFAVPDVVLPCLLPTTNPRVAVERVSLERVLNVEYMSGQLRRRGFLCNCL